MKLSEIIPQFLAEADVQDQSRTMYKQAIEKFFRWVHASRLDPDKLGRADIIKYKTELQSSKLSVATVKNYLTILRIFYRWASQNNIHDDITLGIRSPRYDSSYKKYPLSTTEVGQLMNSIDRSTRIGSRDYAMISLMLHNGLRRIEIAQIDIGDIDTTGSRQGIHIKGKGHVGKDQYVKITNSTMEAIHDYLLTRGEYQNTDPLFANNVNKRMSLVLISRIVKQRLKSIGLDNKYYTCHSLRHTAACLLLQSGFDLHQVQLFMRHKSPSTTQLYTRLVDEQIIEQNKAGEALEKIFQNNQNLQSA